MPLVSVVIPTYNREFIVTKAIDSVLSQTFTDYEIIVVDDGSTDNTKENLKKYREKIRYIYQENSGVSAALNAGINLSTGEWVAILGSDDEWMDDYLYKQIKRAREFPGICMQATNSLFIGLNGETKTYFDINYSLAKFSGKDYLFIEKPFNFVITHGPWATQSTIIRRDALMKAGLFDTSLKISEDFDLMARVAFQGPFGMIREELVKIYRREESIDSLTIQAKKNPIQARESDEKVYEKLKKYEILSYKEHKALNGLLSSNRRAIGNHLLEARNKEAARDSYKRALFFDPSIASLGKYLLSYLPVKINIWINEMTLNIREKRKLGT